MVQEMKTSMYSKKKELVDKLSKVFKQVQSNLEKKKSEVMSELDRAFQTLENKLGRDLDLPKDTRTQVDIWKRE